MRNRHRKNARSGFTLVEAAIASTVLLTTVTDVVGFLAFLGLASAVLL